MASTAPCTAAARPAPSTSHPASKSPILDPRVRRTRTTQSPSSNSLGFHSISIVACLNRATTFSLQTPPAQPLRVRAPLQVVAAGLNLTTSDTPLSTKRCRITLAHSIDKAGIREIIFFSSKDIQISIALEPEGNIEARPPPRHLTSRRVPLILSIGCITFPAHIVRHSEPEKQNTSDPLFQA